MVSHHRGLGTCSRKQGAVGLSTRPGSGFEHVQNVVEWAREGHIALVCVRNKGMAETQCVLQAGGAGQPWLPCCARPGGGEFSAGQGGESLETQWLSSERFQGCVPGWPQSPKKTLTAGKLRARPEVSKRLSGDRWEW